MELNLEGVSGGCIQNHYKNVGWDVFRSVFVEVSFCLLASGLILGNLNMEVGLVLA